ncbi:MAG TPA: tail fiber protein [Sedimentisphaerales bacterium]|jgi:microcystin-dependent protein|nr:tail fiber protein [Sedimentisphaerales bacterium]HNU29036.1 tail fiber protein [Sedimentisphaerales bacterium]
MKTRTIIGIAAVLLSTLWLVQRSDTQAALEMQVVADMPTGSILAYAGSEPPDGWLLCDGELYGVDDSGVNYRQDTETGSSKTGISVNQAVANISINKASTGIVARQTSPAASAASVTVGASAQSVGVGVSEASKGSDAAHNNLQPYIVVNYIIKCY